MQDAFGILVFVVVILAAVIAVAGFAARGRAYDEIGRGGLWLDRSEPARTTAAVVEQEVRQLVVARNARRARRGLAPLDVDAEVRRELDALR